MDVERSVGWTSRIAVGGSREQRGADRSAPVAELDDLHVGQVLLQTGSLFSEGAAWSFKGR